MSPSNGYLSIEIEFDQIAFHRPGCCRFVSVAVRVCDIPKHTKLSVDFQRTQASGNQDYQIHPIADHFQRKALLLESYREYIATFLCRAHTSETGTIALTLWSSSIVLVDLLIRFDSRESQPVLTIKKGRLKAIRFLPKLRSPEARDALYGHYPTLPTKPDYLSETQISLFPDS